MYHVFSDRKMEEPIKGYRKARTIALELSKTCESGSSIYMSHTCSSSLYWVSSFYRGHEVNNYHEGK